jgi:dihydrodipicolinate synthase/N-acetylneuraminate lyase
VDTLRELAQEPNIIGVQDSSGALEYFEEICKLKNVHPDWMILIGPEHLTAELLKLDIDPKVFMSLGQAALEEVES